jgi:tellurite resistance protein
MDDAALIRELNFLGVDTHTWPVLALLPLIQVAWADGEVQDAERALILEMANREYQLDERGHHALKNWLTHAPTEQYLSRGRSAARLLAARQPDIASADTMLAQCEAVARAAGGLFGFRAIDAREQAVLDELSEALNMEPAKPQWDWVDDLDEDLEADADTDEVARRPGIAGIQINQEIEVIEMEEADYAEEHLDAVTVHCTFQPVEAPEEGAPELVRLDTDEVFGMPPGGLAIGRARTNDLWVRDDAQVSRMHCRLFMDAGQPTIEDNESTTGTFVNGERVVRRPLFGGEAITVGQLEFRLDWQQRA